jgi:hypothetical protein
MSAITVRIDDRIRLLSTVLAQTTWPVQEQEVKKYGIHAHARALMAMLGDAENHPAVKTMQELLGTVRGLDEIYTYIDCLSWPDLRVDASKVPAWASPQWGAQLKAFFSAHFVAEVWEKDQAAWDQAAQAAEHALEKSNPAELLSLIFGPVTDTLIFQPNLSFPTADTIGLRMGGELIAVCPPHIAWGNNPPWPYDNDPAATNRMALGAYARALLWEFFRAQPDAAALVERASLPVPEAIKERFPDWFDQFAVLFIDGLLAISTRELYGQPEASGFIMMEKKAHGFEALPKVVEALTGYVEACRSSGAGDLKAYLPEFLKF